MSLVKRRGPRPRKRSSVVAGDYFTDGMSLFYVELELNEPGRDDKSGADSTIFLVEVEGAGKFERRQMKAAEFEGLTRVRGASAVR